MSILCKICLHRDRSEIEKAIASGASSRAEISSRFKVHKDGIRRHIGHSPNLRHEPHRKSDYHLVVLNEVLSATLIAFRAAQREGKDVQLIRSADALVKQIGAIQDRMAKMPPLGSFEALTDEELQEQIYLMGKAFIRDPRVWEVMLTNVRPEQLWAYLKPSLIAYPALRTDIQTTLDEVQRQSCPRSGAS
jgi:hypothetical protein